MMGTLRPAVAVCELTQNRSKYADVQPENEDWDSLSSTLKKHKSCGNETAIQKVFWEERGQYGIKI